MDDQSRGQDPDRAEDEKQLRRDHGVDDEVVVGHAREHLRPGQGGEQGRALKLVQRAGLSNGRGGGLDAGDDADSAEQDEAAQDDDRAIAPVDAARQHHQPDAGHGDHRHDRGRRAQQRALEPLHRRDDGAGATRVGERGLWRDEVRHSVICANFIMIEWSTKAQI
jgi:hypothetical protein